MKIVSRNIERRIPDDNILGEGRGLVADRMNICARKAKSFLLHCCTALAARAGFLQQRQVKGPAGMLEQLDKLAHSCKGGRREFLKNLDQVRAKYLSRRNRIQSTDYFLYVLKACNLVHLRYEYRNKFALLASRPTNYLLDTTNNCQLGCGSCIHTFDKASAAASFLPIQPGAMSAATHALILKYVAPWAYAADYYNMSEPLLNKRTPEYIRGVNKRRVITRISSNFAMPSLDVEALIASGLNYLDLSIDGASQEIYQQYRRGGQIDQVFENVRALIDARNALSSPVPYIRWKYLLFEHNRHETEEAARIARRLGVDEIAFSPGMAGPGGQTAKGYNPDLVATSWSEKFRDRNGLVFTTANEELEEEMEEIARTSLVCRLKEVLGENWEAMEESIAGDRYCDWLYYCPAFDANGRVRSCAIPDYRSRGSLYYASIAADGSKYFNSEKFVSARRATLSGQSDARCSMSASPADDVGCRRCTGRPSPCSQLPTAAGWFMSMGSPELPHSLTVQNLQSLTGWSQHHAN